MNVALIILIILAIIYVPMYIYVLKSPKAQEKGFVPYGPCIMIKTQLGKKLMDKWSKYTKFWRVMGFISKIIAYILMAFIVFILVVDVLALPQMIGKGGIGIEYALAIPGLNPMLPLVYGVIALVIAMVTHELAHGIQARANGMRVDTTGLLHCVVPVGAFVEPNEEDLNKASRRAKGDVYAAGIATNFVIAIVMFCLLSGVLLGMVTTDHEDSAGVFSILKDSPAQDSGVPDAALVEKIGDYEIYIEYVDGYMHVKTADEAFPISPTTKYPVSYLTNTGSAQSTSDIQFGLYVSSVVSDSPASKAGLPDDSFISTMTIVGDTEAENQTFTVYDPYTFMDTMNKIEPNTTVDISYVEKDATELSTVTVTIGDKDGKGYLGVYTSFSGFAFVTPTMILESAKNPTAGADSIGEVAMSLMQYVGSPFKGYSPLPEDVQWWYDVPGGDVFWIITTMVFWIFWLSLVLGVTNALPAVPFDGGFIFAGGVSWVLEKAGFKDEEKREEAVGGITSFVSMFTILILVLVIFVIVF